MFMRVTTDMADVAVASELAGARILITGLSPGLGVDLARAFAEQGARLIIQATEHSAEITELAAVLAETAQEIELHTEPFADADAAFRFAQGPAQVFGGLDAVINLIAAGRDALPGGDGTSEIEAAVSKVLLPATLITRVAANRMRLTLTPGLVLNVVSAPRPATAAETAFQRIIRATLATLTRSEAQQWADQDIRINAIGPRDATEAPGASISSAPELASLALMLAGSKGRRLSGLVFDAESCC